MEGAPGSRLTEDQVLKRAQEHLSTLPLPTLVEEVIMNIYELMNIHDAGEAALPSLQPLGTSRAAKSPKATSLC